MRTLKLLEYELLRYRFYLQKTCGHIFFENYQHKDIAFDVKLSKFNAKLYNPKCMSDVYFILNFIIKKNKFQKASSTFFILCFVSLSKLHFSD